MGINEVIFMWIAFGVILLILWFILFIRWIISVNNKDGRAGRKAIYAIACFILMIVAFVNSGSDDKDLVDSPADKSNEVVVVNAKLDTTAEKEAKKKVETDAKAKQNAEDQAKADEEAKLKAATEAKATEEQKKQNKQSVLDFEQSAYALEATVKPIMDNYQKIMLAVSEGEATIYDAYEAATNAKEAADHLQSEFFKLDIPKGLPKEAKKLLEDAKSDLSTAYYTKGNAFKAVLKFLDDQKPSNMQKFKDESSMSDNFIMSGVLKIMQAKEKVGIDLAAAAE
jgi:hypothetical protein